MSLIKRIQLAFIPADSRILHALHNGHRYVVEIQRAYGVNVGSQYARLIRMETAGLVRSEWDEGAYPRRRGYMLTQQGRVFVERLSDSPMYLKISALIA